MRLTLWRRDVLSGVVELDEALTLRRVSPLLGLITGVPSSVMMRKPLSTWVRVRVGVRVGVRVRMPGRAAPWRGRVGQGRSVGTSSLGGRWQPCRTYGWCWTVLDGVMAIH
mgnify:CR=1 FL=1